MTGGTVDTWTRVKDTDLGIVCGIRLTFNDGRVFVYEYEDYGRVPILPSKRYTIDGQPVSREHFFKEGVSS